MRRLLLFVMVLLAGCGGGDSDPDRLTVQQPYVMTWRESLTISGTFRNLSSVSVTTNATASPNQAQMKASGWSYAISSLVIGDNLVTIMGMDSSGITTQLSSTIHRYELPSPTPGITVLAHRGAASRVPENSLAAVELAWVQGADAVEVDAQLTADGKVVVIHDTTTARTANRSLVVAESNSAELRVLKLRGNKDPRFPVQRIPFLEEVIEAVPPGKKLLIDLKSDGIVPVLLPIFQASGKLPQLMVQSFQRSQLLDLKRAFPEMQVFLVTDAPNGDQLSAAERAAGIDGLSVPEQHVTSAIVERAHALGFHLYSWGVRDREMALQMRSLRVDGILTDVPGLLGDTLRSFPAAQ